MTKRFPLFLFCTVLSFANSFGQNKIDCEKYFAKSINGFCGQSVILFKDSSFCCEAGCEGSSSFAFGKWIQKKNIITCIPVDPATYKVILKIEKQATTDSMLTVIFYDRKGNNITDRVTVAQYIKYYGLKDMPMDSSRTKRTALKTETIRLALESLELLFKQSLEINTDSSNVFNIYLNVSNQWNFNSNSRWLKRGFSNLVKNKGKLIASDWGDTDSNGNFKPLEFIHEQ